MAENHTHSRFIYNSYYYDGHRLDPSDLDLKAYIDERIADNPPPGGGGVESVTGDLVDNTDPVNPVVNLPYLVYTAVLSTENSGDHTSGNLRTGGYYTILDYVAGDDFSNVANVVVGAINTTGCEFWATGAVPTNWANGSTLHNEITIIPVVLENTISETYGDIVWQRLDVGKFRALLDGAANWPNGSEATGFAKTWAVMSMNETISLIEVNYVTPADGIGNNVLILTEDNEYNLQDGWIGNTSVEIRVYP